MQNRKTISDDDPLSGALLIVRYPDGCFALHSEDATIRFTTEQARQLGQALTEFTAMDVLVQAQFAAEDAA